MVFDEKLLCFFIFLVQITWKSDDSSKLQNSDLLHFAMQQETCAIYLFGKSPKTSR